MSTLDPAVAHLQRLATDASIPVSQLAREALVLASRLSDAGMTAWLGRELNGYPTMNDAPEYRWTQGSIKVRNASGMWNPVLFRDPHEEERVSRVASTQGVEEIERVLGDLKTGDYLGVPFPPSIAKQITGGNAYVSQPMVHVATSDLHRVLGHVRNRILEWTLGFGIADVGATAEAADAPIDARVVFAGAVVDSTVVIGDNASTLSVVENNIDLAALAKLLERLDSELPTLGLSPESEAQVRADATAIGAQAHAPRPHGAIMRTLGAGIAGVLKSVGAPVAVELAKHFLHFS